MNYIKEEISKEKYDQCKDMRYGELKKQFDIPIEWECGYGYYGCCVFEKDGKYYVEHTIGSSCD